MKNITSLAKNISALMKKISMEVDPLPALRIEVYSTIDSSTIFLIVDLEQLVRIHRHR